MKKLYVLAFSVLFFFISSRAQNQNHIPPVIEWQKSLGGSKVDKAYTVINTFDHGFLMVGESFSNDGNVTGHHGSTDSSDAWVVKLDASGNIQWQRSLGGTNNDMLVDAVAEGNGDFICVGTTKSNNGDLTSHYGSTDSSDAWVIRISSTGSIVWSKVYGGTGIDNGHAIRKATNGNGYIIAASSTSKDFDVTANYGTSDVWLVNISETGAIQWQKSYGNLENQYVGGLDIASDGSYLISGHSKYADPNSTQFCAKYSRYWRLSMKIDVNGNEIWRQMSTLQCGNPGPSSYTNNLLEMPSGRLLSMGAEHNNSSTPFYPDWYIGQLNPSTGAGITSARPQLNANWFLDGEHPGPHRNILLADSNIVNVAGSRDLYATGIQQFDAYITLVNTKVLNVNSGTAGFHYRMFYGGSNTDVFRSVAVLNENSFLCAGYSNSNNGDVSGNHGDYDCWIVKLSALNKIEGKAFIDNNNNGIKDSNEPNAINFFVESKKNGLVMGSTTDNEGHFLNHVDTGTYTTTLKLQRPYYTVNPVSRQSSFDSLNNQDSFDFALVPIPGQKDLQVSIQPLNRLRPGFKSSYRINYSNEGTESISNTQLRFVKPSKMDYISALPAPAQVSGDTIIWNTGTLVTLDSSVIILTLQAQPLPGVDIGDRLSFAAQIDPVSGDQTTNDNRDTLWQTAGGSFDPNDKNDNYSGTIYAEQLSSFQSLNYTIRFQNTGTDTAFTIIIRDTLTAKLDPSSFQMLGASHPYTFTLKDNKYCTWTFDNIKLVDSNTNESFSHGYISYRIKPLSPLVVGDTVRNRASIYFDSNLPVRTNLDETIVKPTFVPAPPQPIVSGILNSYCSSQGIQKGKIENLPASASGIAVTVKLDATTLTVAADSTFSFDVAAIPEGPHTIAVVYTNGGGSKTTTINFASSITVTPEVIISANVTTIINSNPVLITASNAAGGGTAPLYTFALDRNFSAIVQAEGSNNILFLDPALLLGGDNWVYGRMRTSESCYTIQTSVDSIKLIKILPPVEPTIGGLSATYCNTMGAQYGKITNLPAAGSGISVEVKLDATVLPVAADSTFTIVPYALSSGPHTITVKYTNVAGSKTTTHNFTNTAAIMPDVNVSASITNIVNLTVPVIVTATNAAGGGAGPLYTFGKNRDFTTIWQAESNGNTVTITPSSLTVGDNWIYVRMKSNALCISNDNGVDSIKLTRDISTGITDPDNPGKVISLYPNPFNKQVYISGLSAGKTYLISITSLNGQLMQQNRINNRTNAELILPINKAGTYLLTIYDERKKQSLGTIKIIKQ